MRRRSRRPPNDSESTGKIGQELPSNQPAPLRPSYPDQLLAEPVAAPVRASGMDAAADEERPERRIEVETQPETLGPPPADPTAARAPKGFVVLAIGLPGSGKTTWYKRRGVTPLSSDMLRTILFDDITDQRYQGLVFSTLRSLLRARLIARMPWNHVDATNLSPHERRQWIKMAKSFGYEVHAVFFDVPLAVCMERNSQRERVVTDETMHKLAERLRPPSFKEGFEKITVVRVKGQPGTEPTGSPASTPADRPGEAALASSLPEESSREHGMHPDDGGAADVVPSSDAASEGEQRAGDEESSPTAEAAVTAATAHGDDGISAESPATS